MEEKFSMQDLQQLDDVSYDEVDKILATYEAVRATLTRRIKNSGGLNNPAAYERLDAFFAECNQTRDIKKRRAILAQMKSEFCKGA